MKALLVEGIHSLAKQALYEKDIVVEEYKFLPPILDFKAKEDMVILGVRSRSIVNEKIIKAVQASLRVIGAFCIGTDQIDLKRASQQGVAVFNAPYGNTRSVAELVISHIIALSRQSYRFNQLMHQKKWRKTAQGSKEIRGKVLGIIGYGHIGTQVSILAEALGMEVIYFDIIETLPLGNARPVKTLKELMGLSDFVTLHVPQTELTKNSIQKQELKWMKKGSYLINTSRGSVLNLIDLKQALEEKHILGVALDVFPQEPQEKESVFDCALQGMDQVILTPHIGGSTQEAQAGIAHQVSSSILKYLFHGISESAVNFPKLNPPMLSKNSQIKRLVNIHHNIPGVLGKINGLVSQFKINIESQYLATQSDIGYLIMDIKSDKIKDLSDSVHALKTSIKTHIL